MPFQKLVRARVALSIAIAISGSASSAAAYAVKHTESGEPVRWNVDHVGVHLHASFADMATPGQARRATGMALDAWRGLGAPDLVLSQEIDRAPYHAGTPGTQIVVLSAWPHAPHLLAVTATSYDPRSGRIVDADILVNPVHAFAVLDESGEDAEHFDLGAVLAHETGHVLGLGESDADPLATMWARIGRGDTHQRSLADDDELGIEEAYAGATLAPQAGCGGARIGSITGMPRAIPLTLVVLGVAFALWMTWRQRNDAGARQRGGARTSPARPAGIVFAGALLFLAVPADPAERDEPSAARAARALSARGLRPVERAARLREAAGDPESRIRASALSVVLADPRREDLSIASSLLTDGDEHVRALAIRAASAARRAPPSEVSDRRQIDAEILAPFAAQTSFGQAEITSVERGEDGLLRTRFRVGDRTAIALGGCLEDLCQEVGESLPPRDGEDVVIAEGTGAWARVARDAAYDGWLGEVAIDAGAL
jgi:hypothetical protein